MGRFLPDGTVQDYSGHNTSLFVLGVFILWFGWYGFNPGSQLGLINEIVPISSAAINTTLSPACAGLSSLFTKTMVAKFTDRGSAHFVYDVGKMGNGALCGLAAITASCAVVHPWAAIVIGLVAGFGFVCFSQLVIWCRLDDPLDAISVHAFGFFAAPDLIDQSYPVGTPRQAGVFLGGSGNLLAAQLIHIVWVAGWVLANMIPFFWILKKLKLLRVSPEDEALGLDASYHGGTAYPGESTDVAFSWGGSPSGSQKDNSVRKATENTIEQAPSTSNVVLSKEAKAQQRTMENMQSDIMALQRTVQQLLAAQQEGPSTAPGATSQAAPEPGQRTVQRATVLQPLDDTPHLRQRALQQQGQPQVAPNGVHHDRRSF
ncbi:hypothetical protein WJX84_006690 [Apatococcus fuscideae]|uniref:Ammonium transporter AmtB-like domain-containing protein n=1 Tax=Apatococcus fuscideae TaxID=2026836 RepID=A0AAW1ST17_9CHLO